MKTQFGNTVYTLAAVAILCYSSIATADVIDEESPEITGEIAFAGLTQIALIGSGGLAGATGIDFLPTVLPGNAIVMGATYDFASFLGVFANFNDFQFGLAVDADPLWTIIGNDMQFSAESFVVTEQSNTQLSIRGGGVLSGAGYADTIGSWTFNVNSAGGTVFGWSSTAVPEPGALVLFGIGLICAGLARRRSRTAV